MTTAELIEARHRLHQIAEVSGKEARTAAFVTDQLRSSEPDELHIDVGGYGVVAFYKGTLDKTVLIRAELDALPIAEVNTFDYRAESPGVGHKCGHDGHATILLGLAQSLHNWLERPNVILLFQPAEENGEGAKAVLESGVLKNYSIDYVFALHNIPGAPLHQIIIKNDSFTPAVISIVVKLHGKTSHAAEPENGIPPALAISEIIASFEKLNQPIEDRVDFQVLSPIHVIIGEQAYGTTAGYGEVHYTARTWGNDQMNLLKQELECIAKGIASNYQLTPEILWTEAFFANQNNHEAVDLVRGAAQSSKLEVINKEEPFKWGEDFGVFTEVYKGAMFGLGAGEGTPALHNPDYDFPDTLIQTGIQIFTSIIEKVN